MEEKKLLFQIARNILSIKEKLKCIKEEDLYILALLESKANNYDAYVN